MDELEKINVFSLAKVSHLSTIKYADFSEAAAMLLIHAYGKATSRSVMFRSAPCLLMNLPFPSDNYFRQAEKMLAYGLSGNPSEESAEELRDVWSELITSLKSLPNFLAVVNSRQHLRE